MPRPAFPPSRLLLLPALMALGLTGCATKEFVQKEVEAVNRRIAGLESLVDQAGQRINANVSRIQATEGRLGRAEQDAATLDKRLDETRADLAGTTQNVAGLLVGLNAASQRIDAQAAELAGVQQRLEARVSGAEPADKAMAAAIPAAVVPAVQPPAAAPADLQERLARVGVLIDEVHRRINVNTSSLQNANLRIGQLESGMAAAGKRGEEIEAILDAVRNKTAAAHEQLASADQRISANTHALEQMGPHIDAAEADLKRAATRLDEAEKRLGELGGQLARNDAADAAVSATAREALERAQAAGKLAEGRLLAETVLSESIGFQLKRSGLSESARLALLAFADKLKAENQGVYIEIQGHTDDTGPAETNLRLSRQRAEAVRDFLHQEAGIPLHRLAVAAYGEARPVADNKTREGRVMNRRVVLVVLK